CTLNTSCNCSQCLSSNFCPDDYRPASIIPFCKRDNITSCLECEEGYGADSQYPCVKNCPQGEYAHIIKEGKGYECRKCEIPDCDKCLTSTQMQCEKCRKGFLTPEGACNMTCNGPLVSDYENMKCVISCP